MITNRINTYYVSNNIPIIFIYLLTKILFLIKLINTYNYNKKY